MTTLLLCLLLTGAVPAAGSFSFCGRRNQSKGGNFLRYHFSPGDDNVTIDNSAEALHVSAPFRGIHVWPGGSTPFPPSYNIILQDQTGLFTFCLRWIPALQLFNFTYGITVSHLIHTDPAPEEQQPSQPHQQHACSSAFHLINVTIDGRREPEKCCYQLPVRPQRYDAEILESEIAQVNDYLEKGPFSRDQRRLRGWVEEALSLVEFSGDSHYFGGGALQAAVYKLESGNETEGLSEHLGVSLTLPSRLLERAPDGVAKRLHVVSLRGHTFFQDAANSSLLGNLVLGVTLQNTKVSDLPEDIVITFPHQPLQGTASALCVFWAESSEEWSVAGCRTVAAERQTECRCNHLTYFAVLMQISSPVISEVHLVSLTVLTFAGCTISALACAFTIAWISCSRKSQANPTLQIHMNLLGALLLLDVGFIVSAVVGGAEEAGLCQGAAAVLHLALLSLFSWMAVEGFNLYRLVVKVFLSSTITTGKLALLAWGAPALTVLIVFLVDAENYGMAYIRVDRPSSPNSTAVMCWLTRPFLHHVLNLGFFAAVLLFNVCMLGAMTRRVLRLSPHSRRDQRRHCLTLLGLSCMLGLSWGLAFFSFGVFYLPVQYAFSLLNTLQGLFILLWYWALSQPHPRDPLPSSHSTSGTPASPPPDLTLSSDHKTLLT